MAIEEQAKKPENEGEAAAGSESDIEEEKEGGDVSEEEKGEMEDQEKRRKSKATPSRSSSSKKSSSEKSAKDSDEDLTDFDEDLTDSDEDLTDSDEDLTDSDEDLSDSDEDVPDSFKVTSMNYAFCIFLDDYIKEMKIKLPVSCEQMRQARKAFESLSPKEQGGYVQIYEELEVENFKRMKKELEAIYGPNYPKLEQPTLTLDTIYDAMERTR